MLAFWLPPSKLGIRKRSHLNLFPAFCQKFWLPGYKHHHHRFALCACVRRSSDEVTVTSISHPSFVSHRSLFNTNHRSLSCIHASSACGCSSENRQSWYRDANHPTARSPLGTWPRPHGSIFFAPCHQDLCDARGPGVLRKWIVICEWHACRPHRPQLQASTVHDPGWHPRGFARQSLSAKRVIFMSCHLS